MFNSIRSKLFFSFFLVLLFTVGLGVTTYWFTQQNNALVVQAIDRDFKGSTAITELAISAQAIRRYEKEYFMYVGNAEKMTKYNNDWLKTHAILSEKLQAMRFDQNAGWTEQDQANFAAWQQGLDAYEKNWKQVVNDVNAGLLTNTLAANSAIQEGKNAFRVMVDGTIEAAAQKLDVAQATAATIKASSEQLTLVMIGLVAASVVLCLLLLVVVPNSITKPIKTLSGFAETMSKGDLENSVPKSLSVKDFDSLAGTLERMRISQKTLMDRFLSKSAA